MVEKALSHLDDFASIYKREDFLLSCFGIKDEDEFYTRLNQILNLDYFNLPRVEFLVGRDTLEKLAITNQPTIIFVHDLTETLRLSPHDITMAVAINGKVFDPSGLIHDQDPLPNFLYQSTWYCWAHLAFPNLPPSDGVRELVKAFC